MRFTKVPSAATTPNPITNPEDVPLTHVFVVPESQGNSDHPIRSLAIGSTDAAAVTVVNLYAQMEDEQNPFALDQNSPKTWRQFDTVTLVAGQLVEASPVPPGRIYAQISSAPGAAGSQLLIGMLA